MRPFFIFVLGATAFIAFSFIAKLYRSTGTKLRMRMSYALGLSLFLTSFALWQTDGNINAIGKGLLLGIILSIPFCFYMKRLVEKNLEGTKFYTHKQHLKNLAWIVLVIVLLQIVIHSNIGKHILKIAWPVLGLTFSWFVAEAFILVYIVKLEKKLGAPILEDTR